MLPVALAIPLSAERVQSKQPAAERIKWADGEALELLTEAVDNWLAKKGPIIEHSPDISLKHYCGRVEVPYNTLRMYVCSDPGKRRKLGVRPGIKALLDDNVTRFTVDMLRAKDRANDGMNRRQAIDMIQDLRPELSRRQLELAFDRRIRPDNKDVLTGIIKAQASTVKRSQITVAQQYRWFTCVDRAFAFLRERNTGTTPGGLSFGEVMADFILGGDESGLLASNGDVAIIGDKAKKKHEVTTAGSRTSITIYRSGSAAGSDGPTAFLPPGKYRKHGYNDAFLVKHGAAVGSTIAMTDSGYMTEAAWIEIAPSMVRGIRAMPVICDNPDWWVVKIIDGFGPHTSSLKAMEIYEKAKIMLLKEEAETSHVCQAYDQEVAKADKRSMRKSLAFLRKTTDVTKGVVDGWQLIHVGLAMVRELESDSWIYSFKKVNLHPHHRVSFPEWCERISHFLQGGQSFKSEVVRDSYALLPSWWHGFLPEQKKRAATIFASHGNSYSVACVQELTGAQGLVLPAEMHNLRLCLDLAAEDPSHLDRGLPEAAAIPEEAEVVAAQANVDVNKGLVTFQLFPKKSDGTQLYTGLALFEHMVKMARRTSVHTKLAPSARLDCEYTEEQERLLDPTALDFSMQAIMATVHGAGASHPRRLYRAPPHPFPLWTPT